MLQAYVHSDGRLDRLAGPDLSGAVWIDLLVPTAEDVDRVKALGIDVPTLEDMEEIEISNRLYQEGGLDYMTLVLPGQSAEGGQIASPVCMILGPDRMVTVRHHSPRPFETFPTRANQSATGCRLAEEVFMGLLGEIIGRLADLLETVGKALDMLTSAVFSMAEGQTKPAMLGRNLANLGQQGDALSRVRLGLLTLDRALSFYAQARDMRGVKGPVHIGHAIKSLGKDIKSLEVHCDFLSGRVGLASDATIGMINLAQNGTVRILSVVAALFLPPTLIASIYGMNFKHMPELDLWWAYPAALGVMLASSLVTYLILRWKNWL
ncbi:MAG: magnesium transporter CorA family protein [Paracoccaceae bacterium]